MNTENAKKMTQALSLRGHEPIVVASGDILLATAKAKLHAAEKVRTILPSSAKFDGKKWATTYEGQYVTDPAEIARLRDEAKLNEEAALRLGKISGKGEAQEVFLKSGPVVEMDKKSISEYMKGLDKQAKVRQDQAAAPAKPKAPKAKQSEGEVGSKVAKNVAKKEDPKVVKNEGEAGKENAKTVSKREGATVTKGKKIPLGAPSAKEAAKKTATAGEGTDPFSGDYSKQFGDDEGPVAGDYFRECTDPDGDGPGVVVGTLEELKAKKTMSLVKDIRKFDGKSIETSPIVDQAEVGSKQVGQGFLYN